MGRKRKFDSHCLLHTVGKTFAQYGYTRTSMTQLEKATETFRGTFYQTFSNKQTLFRQALELYVIEEPESLVTVDLVLVAYHEVVSIERSVYPTIENWRLYVEEKGSSVAWILGNRLINRTQSNTIE